MTFKGTLLDFQREAVDMMLDRRFILLAHTMGLGKTVQAIAAVEELIDTGEVECALIICPASIKWQWKHQIDRFSDGALVKVIEGTKGDRMAQYRSVKRGDVEYVIMNYEQVVADWDTVRLLAFDAVVTDECAALKNPGSKRSRHIRRLQTPYRFGLTGQPIENRPEELFSIMQWVDDSVLGNERVFDRTFIVRNTWGGVKHYKHLGLLRETMEKSMHRKTRSDVRDQMPAVVEKSYIIDFDPATYRLYRRIVGELLVVIQSVPKFSNFNLLNHYSGTEDAGPMGEIMPRLMALRMLCNNPELLKYSADQFDDPDTAAGSQYASTLRASGVLDKLTTSPKTAVTLEVIEEILEADPRNKIVVFSFFKPMLALLSGKLKVDHEIFTGDLSARERDEALERFSKNKNCRVLLSSDAGGVGVDIPQANYLISVDLPWSAGKFEQRNGRILRISSKWPEVTLLSMLMKDSIEERMWDLLETKSAIAAAWLDGKGLDKQGSFTLTLGTLESFLAQHH